MNSTELFGATVKLLAGADEATLGWVYEQLKVRAYEKFVGYNELVFLIVNSRVKYNPANLLPLWKKLINCEGVKVRRLGAAETEGFSDMDDRLSQPDAWEVNLESLKALIRNSKVMDENFSDVEHYLLKEWAASL
jgi:hypothetical protein